MMRMMSKIKVLSITTDLTRFGGAQKVLLDVHNGIKKDFDSKIIGRHRYEDLHPKYRIKETEYIQLKSPADLRNAIILVHARNVIPFIVLLKAVFLLRKTKIIYISHNVYNTYRNFTLFPKNIVSISNKVTENLKTYFGRKEDCISLIYNGIKDANSKGGLNIPVSTDKIKILYPARVNNVKRQLEIVEKLEGKLSRDIEIHFAGIGDDYEKLTEACKTTNNFKALGFVENMDSLIPQYHYLMLYSFQEGLPIALLEGIMYGRPLLVNDIGGNLEIGKPGVNAIELHSDWNILQKQLNDLKSLEYTKYREMCIESRKLFLDKFQYSSMIDNYKQLIHNICN